MKSFKNEQVRLLQHDNSIIAEDDLDARWEEVSGESVQEIIFLSKHTAVSNRPAITVHPIGIPHLRDGEVPPQGGKPGWAAPPLPRMGPWLRRLKSLAASYNLVPEFEVVIDSVSDLFDFRFVMRSVYGFLICVDYVGGDSSWTGDEQAYYVCRDW